MAGMTNTMADFAAFSALRVLGPTGDAATPREVALFSCGTRRLRIGPALHDRPRIVGGSMFMAVRKAF